MQPLITTLKFYSLQKQKPTQNQIHIEFEQTPIKIYHLYCFKTPKKKKKLSSLEREERTNSGGDISGGVVRLFEAVL